MVRMKAWMLAATLVLAACDSGAPSADQSPIKVRSAEQDALHTLNALNLSIALKRAIYAAGYACRRVTDAGFVEPYDNLDMWTATCDNGRQWAIFAGPDGSAQVRDCKDIPGTGLPECVIKKRPQGSFDGPIAPPANSSSS